MKDKELGLFHVPLKKYISLALQKRCCLWEISVISNFHIFFPKWDRSSCLAKAEWDRKFNSVHRPTLGSTATRLRHFWLSTCWQWPAQYLWQNIYQRDDVCPNLSVLSQTTWHHATHRGSTASGSSTVARETTMN